MKILFLIFFTSILSLQSRAAIYCSSNLFVNFTFPNCYALSCGTNFDDGSINSNKLDSDSINTLTHPLWANIQGAPSVLNGTNGLNGAAGATGATGATGSQGIQGIAGSNSPPHQFFAGTRSLNSSFIASSNTDSIVKYSVDVASSLSLSGGTVGGVLLETSTNNSNWVFYDGGINANIGTLTIGLNTWQTNTISVGGCIPAGYWIRIKTTNIVGSPAFSFRSGNETWF